MMHSVTKRSVLLLIASSLLGSAFTAPALAEREGPPNAHLEVAGIQQQGNRRSYCWDGICGVCACWAFPQARRAPTGKRARIVLAAPLRVRSVDLDGWRDAQPTVEGPAPAGPKRNIHASARPLRDEEGEIVARLVRFTLPPSPGHLYLDLNVGWGAGRRASYSFHLNLT